MEAAPCRVERLAEDRWRVTPADETWLRLVAAGALAAGPAAVIKEHPQDRGVLLLGSAPALRASGARLRARLQELAGAAALPLRVPSYGEAALLRRAVMTRPACLAATEVTFTDAVESLEAEPLAAHRFGMLAFRCAPGALRSCRVELRVPGGQAACAGQLLLPEGVRLAPGLERFELGVRARAAEGAQALALVTLEVGSVWTRGHAKFMGVSAVSFRPEARVVGEAPSPEPPARREFLEQQGARLEPPGFVELDFDLLSFDSKEAVVREACERVVEELDGVLSRLEH